MTTVSVTYYPYYGRASLDTFEALAARPSTATTGPRPATAELRTWQQIVDQVEEEGAVSEANGEFLVDAARLEKAIPDAMARQAVLHCVAKANANPAPIATASAAAGQGAATAADIIKDLLGVGADVPGIQKNVVAIAAGTTLVSRRWWGIELAFTRAAAQALSALLGSNLGSVTTLLTALATVPGLAILGTVSAVATAILKGLSTWIDAANAGESGVLLTLYGWILPFIRLAPAKTTAQTPTATPAVVAVADAQAVSPTALRLSRSLTADRATLTLAQGLKDELLAIMFGVPAQAARRDTRPTSVFPTGGNILGVGYGAKLTDGSVAGERAVRVYVRQKLPKSRLSKGDIVPSLVSGETTDVIAVGEIVALAHQWPTQCGVSVGHFAITAGTLGCRVAKAGDAGAFILSNNHVLANVNNASVGDDILQPGPIDGGERALPPVGDIIGSLDSFLPIDFNATNSIDAAIARLNNAADADPAILDTGRVNAPPMEASLHQSVRKQGRTTGHTMGVIQDVSAFIKVRYDDKVATFDNQLSIAGTGPTGFSDGGDSGSLIIDAVTGRAVGLLFAGGGAQTFANPIGPVLAHFGVTIV